MNYLSAAFLYEMQASCRHFEQANFFRLEGVPLALACAVIAMLVTLFVIYCWVFWQPDAAGQKRHQSQGEQLSRILALAGILILLLDQIVRLIS